MNIKKIVTLSMAIIMAAGIMTGCGSSKPQSAEQTGVDKSQTLLIYSNSASDGRGDWLTQKAEEAGYHIQIVSIGGGDLTNRLIAEKNNSQADLVYGLNSIEYEKLKKEDLLLKYKPTWESEVDMSLGDSEGYYYPTVVQPLVLIYNNQYKDAPSDWIDLATNPKYKGIYNIFNLGGASGKYLYASILARYPDPNGEDGISEEGWKVAKEYFNNAHMSVDGEDYVGKVINGSMPMSLMWGSGVIQNQKERNYKFNIMTPEIGEPYVVEQVAIISKTNKAALAQDFANWFGSAEIQAAWSAKFGSIPANKKALETVSDDVKEFMKKVHSQKMDWTLVNKYIDKWVEKAQLEFIK